ncbi:MAG: alpha/beta hydrolase [Gammaproteobacteria bacterium]|nr:alpha/beta hydrolase [Gammaproteobacteria bacterium]MBU2058849.1 alpha/beta hydrolase [Gammaproteobacteria bacterium]MBU2177088.1 alpha/beta hydrolase [Gammaproteobacteria bacterium]MBU2247074.1 alpha/beta hydrolase [Gammaproteobacteria bacterium]MBU2345448.1 alpha/beta hydrolase [Gammaproteobacteria bacterium]
MQTTVLMLHSSLSSGRQWQGLKMALKAEYEVLNPDLMGYGSNTISYPRPMRLSDEASHLWPLLEGKPEGSVILIGHSFGGAVALHMARTRPELFKAVLVFEPVAFHLLKDAESDLYQQVQHLSQQMLEVSAKDAAALFIDYWQGNGYFANLPQVMQHKLVGQVGKVAADFEALSGEPATIADYAKAIRCPVLVLSGEHSQWSAQRLARMLADALPCVEFQTIKTGHMGPVTDAELVNSVLLEFILPLA